MTSESLLLAIAPAQLSERWKIEFILHALQWQSTCALVKSVMLPHVPRRSLNVQCLLVFSCAYKAERHDQVEQKCQCQLNFSTILPKEYEADLSECNYLAVRAPIPVQSALPKQDCRYSLVSCLGLNYLTAFEADVQGLIRLPSINFVSQVSLQPARRLSLFWNSRHRAPASSDASFGSRLSSC